MIKCHLSVINLSSVVQFQDINLSNHDFDSVACADFDNVSGAEVPQRLEQLLNTDLSDKYYSVCSQSQCRSTRLVRESLDYLYEHRPRGNLCPNLTEGFHQRPLCPNI